MMKKLVYYIDKGFGNYEAFYEYAIPNVSPDEIYARQLCTYLIKDGKQYELTYNEMYGSEEHLILKEMSYNKTDYDEKQFPKVVGIPIEFRKLGTFEEHTHLSSKVLKSHWEVIRYLLKDSIEVPEKGLFKTTSTELDEDRGCYVIYVKDI